MTFRLKILFSPRALVIAKFITFAYAPLQPDFSLNAEIVYIKLDFVVRYRPMDLFPGMPVNIGTSFFFCALPLMAHADFVDERQMSAGNFSLVSHR